MTSILCISNDQVKFEQGRKNAKSMPDFQQVMTQTITLLNMYPFHARYVISRQKLGLRRVTAVDVSMKMSMTTRFLV